MTKQNKEDKSYMKQAPIRWTELITHEDSRRHFQFQYVFIIMAFISAAMTVMNYFTGWKGALMHATLYFAALNIVNAVIEHFGSDKVRIIPRVLFAVEIIVLFTFFILNGQPKGFSTLWAALMPACGLLLYRKNIGSLIAGIQLVIIVFLFYFPAGRQLLGYDYNDVFMMRFPVLYSAFFIVGYFFELVRHNTQRELSAARDNYQKLFESEEVRANREKETNYRIMHVLTDEYWVVMSVNMNDGKMEVHSGNQYFGEPFIELPFQSAIMLYCMNQVSEAYRSQFQQFFSQENIRESLKNKSSIMLTYSTRIDGKERYLQAKIVKIPSEDGSLQQIIVAISDTDAYVREQQRIQQELRTQQEKAENASMAKTDFLFNMSHDIRTPMNAIIGFTDMAFKDVNDPAKVCEDLRKVRLSSNLLLTLINDILDMSRIESGKASVSPVKTNLKTIFSNVQSVMEDSAAAKDITISFDASAIRDHLVLADIARVDRILVNLVSNAVKYTECGGRVQVTCMQLDTDEPDASTYRFIVKDNGIGMSDKFQKHMFENFAREENSTTSGIQGTGLGLPLTKKLTEMLGGTIVCESKRGIGTTFTVTLPFGLQDDVEVDADALAEASVPATQVESTHFEGKCILVVEDNELNREIVTCILEELGVTVEAAVNGRDAVRMVYEKGPTHYDLILMDIQMPIMNGYEATRQIRELYPEVGLPIIALSANSFEEDKQKSIEAGMNGHISKPVSIDELAAAIHKNLMK